MDSHRFRSAPPHSAANFTDPQGRESQYATLRCEHCVASKEPEIRTPTKQRVTRASVVRTGLVANCHLVPRMSSATSVGGLETT
jgi:hypothetical protein